MDKTNAQEAAGTRRFFKGNLNILSIDTFLFCKNEVFSATARYAATMQTLIPTNIGLLR
jgi:hypothetical protein